MASSTVNGTVVVGDKTTSDVPITMSDDGTSATVSATVGDQLISLSVKIEDVVKGLK